MTYSQQLQILPSEATYLMLDVFGQKPPPCYSLELNITLWHIVGHYGACNHKLYM
jgi:hypothetical protein